MVKAIEAIIVLTLLAFSFFIGVKYSETVKSHASWLFETKEEEVDLPDLSNENSGDVGTVDESGVNAEGGAAAEGAPMDSIDIPSDSTAGIDAAAPAAQPVAAPAAQPAQAKPLAPAKPVAPVAKAAPAAKPAPATKK